jgi:D-arabinose 1-dehydrogenase-like Zn-dependent alcohol dehydrogenase
VLTTFMMEFHQFLQGSSALKADFCCTGIIKPLPAIVFKLGDAPAAFRQLSAAKHVGKVVVEVPRPLPLLQQVSGRWIISGGLGALGAITVHWLASQGDSI